MSTIPHIIKHRGDGRASWCVHFNGHGKNDVCKAGVKYDDVKCEVKHTYSNGPSTTKGTYTYTSNVALPCFKDEATLTGGCQSCRFPTPEEIAKDVEEMVEFLGRTMKARLAIVEHLGGKEGGSGIIDCPVCGTGKLRYSRAACNGHIHAACSTETCVRWME